MNFNQALDFLKDDRKVKRTDWEDEDYKYLDLSEFFSPGTSAMLHTPGYVEIYGFTFEDTQSECWEEVL